MANGKNFKQSRDHNHALLWVICHPVARIYIAYMCTKYDDLRLNIPVIWLEPPFLMGHMTWPRPYQVWFVGRRLWLKHVQPVHSVHQIWSLCYHQLRRCMHKAMQKVRGHPRSSAT